MTVKKKKVITTSVSKQASNAYLPGELSPNPLAANPLAVENPPDKMEVTKGDVIRLRYNSDDSYGIRVESVEFIENKPGTVTRGDSTLWVLLPIVALAMGGLLILIRQRRSRVAR